MEYIKELLSLSDRPAFCVENGSVIAANEAAQALQIRPADPLESLLGSDRESLSGFSQGFLCLSLSVFNQQIPATVTALGDRLIFTLEPEELREELRLLGLASQELREPLSDVMALVKDLNADPAQMAQINRGLHRMLRLIGNMTPHPTPRMELVNVSALLEEFQEKAQIACEGKGIQFRFISSPKAVLSCVDEDLLKRAIYNLLSNAMKFSRGGTIILCLKQSSRSYQISLHDSSSLLPDQTQDPFARFLRQPGLGDPSWGMGLGMRLVRDAAIAHGGTVLMDTPLRAASGSR
jgi:signal transduction histidine kinase